MEEGEGEKARTLLYGYHWKGGGKLCVWVCSLDRKTVPYMPNFFYSLTVAKRESYINEGCCCFFPLISPKSMSQLFLLFSVYEKSFLSSNTFSTLRSRNEKKYFIIIEFQLLTAEKSPLILNLKFWVLKKLASNKNLDTFKI